MTAVSAEQVGSGDSAGHIARTAARLFALRGYDATSVREIVEAAGVTKPTLYYHFGSKEGLAQALLTVPLDRLVATFRGLLAGSDDPVEALVGMIEANFAFCRDDPDRARFIFALFFGPLGSGLAAEVGRFGEELTELWTAAAHRLAGAGRIDPDRAEAFAANVRGLVVISVMDFLYRGGDLGPGLARRLVGDVRGGFAAPGPGRK